MEKVQLAPDGMISKVYIGVRGWGRMGKELRDLSSQITISMDIKIIKINQSRNLGN